MGKMAIKKAIEQVNEQGAKAFVPYIMAGDPSIDDLKDQLHFLQQSGATVIELGIPFSDPAADGPVIQEAGKRALSNGASLSKILEALSAIKETLTVPIVLMTYINPLYKYGLNKVFQDIEDAGVSGLIIPDLPYEQNALIQPFISKTDLAVIQLVTLTSPEERIKTLAEASEGFLYAVSVTGITGERANISEKLESFISRLKSYSSVPVLAGFGISTPEQVKEVSSYGDGVIVGSKIVDLQYKNLQTDIENLIHAAVK
ncbi:tryptophan synthase subunit alpha [Jeotgalibacillus haloalkalitolerans]|uniref:Tryptophan synthase alpha chain n=1 Tax=Jeotgalibacillus haloalkalitolerans TaxID=3104292 RepID=A0ABU5KKW4_9BACL|nr:tryptophan synthase subunit alpha [Jeotgalibacillus sp. HH7-29]MDZ5711907.1 tryptophan synthase subunit alpha [Jeotgalibacillus sp. HH7-29]